VGLAEPATVDCRKAVFGLPSGDRRGSAEPRTSVLRRRRFALETGDQEVKTMGETSGAEAAHRTVSEEQFVYEGDVFINFRKCSAVCPCTPFTLSALALVS
jgi:hypothetical protein